MNAYKLEVKLGSVKLKLFFTIVLRESFIKYNSVFLFFYQEV